MNMKIFRKVLSIALILWISCSTFGAFAMTERNYLHGSYTEQQVKEILVMNQKWVKFPQYSDREGWDELMGEMKTHFIKNGERSLNYNWQVIKATDYLAYDRTGNRKIMENIYSANNTALYNLIYAELAEGKGRFIDQIINGVFFFCEMTTWSLSAHLHLQPVKQSFPIQGFDVIELSSSDLSTLLAWTYYFLHKEFDKVHPEISRRLYAELDRRVMKSYLINDSFWWLGFEKDRLVNNWNPWCNSNALMVFMLLENDRDRLAKAVYRSMTSVDQFYNYVKADGACEEGPSYWGHAGGKAYDYISMLETITEGKITIYDKPQVKNLGEYILRSYVGNGWVVNFADATAKGGGDPYLIYRYGKSVQSKPMQQFASYLFHNYSNQKVGGRDMYRMLEALSIYKELKETDPNYEKPRYSWYPETEFCYIRNDKAFLASKGGYNDESHNHNDAGTFTLWVDEKPVLIDAGVGTYTKKTFSAQRYDIWSMQSNYHNLPMINGVPQRYGKQYKATQVKATRTGFSADISTAYPEEAAVNSWIRSYLLKNRELVIKDRFDLKEAKAANEVNFMTWGDVTVKDGTVEIVVDGTRVVLEFDSNLFDAKKETIHQDDIRLSKIWGDEIYRINLKAKNKAIKGNYSFKVNF